MKCPVCGAAELVRDTRDRVFAYKGRRTTIRGLVGDYCPACGEVVLDNDSGVRYTARALAFQREVNAKSGAPDLIAAVRKKLALDQREAAELFGGGVNAFSRYETGAAQPPRALVQLFRLLDKHPRLLSELRR